MQRALSILVLLSLFSFPACGSGDDGGGNGASGGSGSGGAQGTTCADGYPKVGTACAIQYEKCTSCGSGTWACCDVFECQAGAWAQTQFHTLCPSDGGADANDAGDANDASHAGDASDADDAGLD